jgi:hypothetical protein
MRIFILLNILFATLLLNAQIRETEYRLPLPGEVQKQHRLNSEDKAPLFEKPISYPAAKSTYGYIDTTYRIRYSDGFWDVNDWDSAYFISGYVRDSTHYYYDPDHPTLLGLMKVDYSGHVLWKRTDSVMRGDHFTALNTSLIKLTDGNFLQVGHVKNDYNNWKNYDWRAAVYTKFDADGNTIWQKIFKDTTYLKSGVWPMSVISEDDGGFTITALVPSDSKHFNPYDTADTYLYTDTTYIGLIRYDSLGNEMLRQRHFIGGHTVIPTIGLLIKQPDKGYIVGGVNYFSGDLKSYYLLKTDSLFNWEWRKTFGQTSISDPYFDIISTPKNQYYFAIARSDTPIVYDAYGNKYYNGYYQVGLFDDSFNIIKDTVFKKYLTTPPSIYHYDAGWVIGASIDSDLSFTLCSYIGTQGANIVKLDSNFTFQWSRWIAQYPYFQEEAYKMRRAHDGGYLIVGRSSRQGVGGWFVKTDSLGFALPNGGDTLYHIGIEEFEVIQKQELILYPNPARDNIQIAINIQGVKVEQVVIFDINGREVLRKTFSDFLVNMNVSSLNKGIYMIKVIGNNGRVFNSKFIKE